MWKVYVALVTLALRPHVPHTYKYNIYVTESTEVLKSILHICKPDVYNPSTGRQLEQVRQQT
jgi:hypothetical protein